jgi:peroxiredoxin
MKHILTALFLFTLSISIAQTTGYKPGDKAIDFSLKNIDEKVVSLKDYKDAKGFIVVFTCNHCPYAKAYEGRIEELNQKYAAKGYPVIAINPNDPVAYPEDSYENMQKNAAEKKFTFPYLWDETQEIAKAYGALKTPHVYILKKVNNDLIVKYIGAIDDNTENPKEVKKKYAENALNELLQEKSVKEPVTKAIGCSIKWKK